MDEVDAAGGPGHSNVRAHRSGKGAEPQGIADVQAGQVLAELRRRLAHLCSVHDLHAWLEELLLAGHANALPSGRQLGSLAGMGPGREPTPASLAEHLRDWENLLAEGLQRLHDAGGLRPQADPSALATAIMAALHGGNLLAEVSRDPSSVRVALGMALAHVKAQLADTAER